MMMMKHGLFLGGVYLRDRKGRFESSESGFGKGGELGSLQIACSCWHTLRFGFGLRKGHGAN